TDEQGSPERPARPAARGSRALGHRRGLRAARPGRGRALPPANAASAHRDLPFVILVVVTIVAVTVLGGLVGPDRGVVARVLQLVADALGEAAGLPGLSALATGERQRQPNHDAFDLKFARQGAELAQTAPRQRARHGLDRSGQEPGWVADRAAATSAPVVQGK